MVRFWQRLWDGSRKGNRRQPARPAAFRPRRFRPLLEELEKRLVLSATAHNTAELRADLATPPSDNTIILEPGTYNTEADGGGTFVISSDVILRGAGAGSTFLDGNGTDRVFSVNAGVTAQFFDVTIQNGNTSGNGAGIDAESGGSIVVLSNSNVTDNTSTGGEGGGIAVSGGEVRLINSAASFNMSSGGGAIFASDSNVTLELCNLHDNTVVSGGTDGGGGILAQHSFFGSANTNTYTVQVTDSTINHNTVNDTGAGGGILTEGENVVLDRSTLSNNSAFRGGGGLASEVAITEGAGPFQGQISITNTTISSNFGGGAGGGILTTTPQFGIDLTNATVTQNTTEGDGGGIDNAGDTVTVLNTIVAGNTALLEPDVGGTYVSLGHNIIGDAGNSTGFTNGVNNDQVGVTAAQLHLGPLQYNGGPMDGPPPDQSGLQTHALLPGSVAIDQGQDNVVTTDERGVPRPQGAHTDVGAYEFALPSVTTTPVSATEGATFSGQVATFTDANLSEPSSDFTATIAWGDGTSSTGTVTGSSGSFTVTGSHAYTEEGAYTGSVTVSETGAASASAALGATVANAPLSVTAAAISATEGTTFSGQVATFTDAGGLEADRDYSATIDWGDGTVTSGAVRSGTVSGSHAYAEEGTETISVTVIDDPGSSLAASASGSAAIAVANAPLDVTATPVSATEGATFTGQVATFTDTGGAEPTGDYSASIAWGDGLSTPGTVTNTGGSLAVTGSHAYAEEGTYAVTVTVTDDPGSPLPASASDSSTATVADASLAATPGSVSATEGATFNGVVASFTDADPNGQPGDYTDTITWGDGTSSAGSVVANGQGGFNVLGSHAYSEEGTYTVAVTVNDVGGASASAGTTAVVADAPLTAQGVALFPAQATTFSGTVANFTDADPNGILSDYTATISWGDGTTTSGSIVGSEQGGFQVQGSHAYLQRGNYAVQVVIHDLGGASATAASSAAVAAAPFTFAAAFPQQGLEGSAMNNVVVATFIHGGGAEPAGLFTATINWGDGTVTPGTVTQGGNGTYSVAGSHTYLDEPPIGLVTPGGRFWPITVTVADPSSRSSVNTVGIVIEPLPPGTADVGPLRPFGTANDRFIAELFNDLTGGRIDAATLNRYAASLRHHSRRSFVEALLTPPLLQALHARAVQAGGGSSATALVQGYYRLFLDRPVGDPGPGLGKLAQGGESGLITFLLASEEYFSKTVVGG